MIIRLECRSRTLVERDGWWANKACTVPGNESNSNVDIATVFN